MTEVRLPLDLPEALSDEAVVQLVACLHEFARCVESCYYGQLHRYYQNRGWEPEPGIDPRQGSLWSEEDVEF